MKVFSQITLAALMLILITACGKDNKSGKNDDGNCIYTLTGCSNSLMSGYGNINSPYSYNGVSVNTILNENQCLTGNSQRMQFPGQVTMSYTIQAGDLFVGVTSFGDVAVIAGNGTRTANFVGYLCQRQGTPMAPPTTASLGIATRCQFKPITAANMQFSNGEVALFRFLDGGSSLGRPFSICQ